MNYKLTKELFKEIEKDFNLIYKPKDRENKKKDIVFFYNTNISQELKDKYNQKWNDLLPEVKEFLNDNKVFEHYKALLLKHSKEDLSTPNTITFCYMIEHIDTVYNKSQDLNKKSNNINILEYSALKFPF